MVSAGEQSVRITGSVTGSVIIAGSGNNVSMTVYAQREAPFLDSTASDKEGNPYRGLACFTETHARYFFGRSELIEELRAKFRRLHDDANGIRFLAVVGPSGFGKSSVVRAGLLPSIVVDPPDGVSEWKTTVLTPTDRPLEALALALARTALDSAASDGEVSHSRLLDERDSILARLRRTPPADALRDLALLRHGSERLLLFVDQFEELYALGQDRKGLHEDQIRFLEILLSGVRGQTGISVAITLRSDFLPDVGKHAELSKLISRQGALVMAMGRDDLRLAIDRPARVAGRALPETLIARILDEVSGQDGALPLLEFALTRIWEAMSRGEDGEATLDRLGGVGGALASRAEEIFTALEPNEDGPRKRMAKRLLLSMVRITDGGGAQAGLARRRLSLSDMEHGAEARELLERFATPDARLVTLFAEGDEPTASFTHESIFKHWGTLRRWIAAQQADLSRYDDLENAAKRWQREGKPRDLLLVSKQLTQARQLRFREAVTFSVLVAEYVDRSITRQRIARAASAAVVITVTALSAWGVHAQRNRALDEAAAAVLEPPENMPCNYFLADSHPTAPPSALAVKGPQGAPFVTTGREGYRREEEVKEAYGAFIYERSQRRCNLVQDASALLKAGGAATAGGSVVAFGSQMSNSYVRMIMGDAKRDQPRFDVDLADYHGRLRWNAYLPINAPSTMSMQDGHRWPQGESRIGGLDDKDNKYPDYLLVTVLPTGLAEQGRIIIFAGLHGPGTSATKLLLSPESWRDLRRVSRQMRGERAFQLLFGVSVQERRDHTKEPTGIKLMFAHRIYLDRRDPNVPPVEVQAWQSAIIDTLRSRGLPALNEAETKDLYACRDLAQLRKAHEHAVSITSPGELLEGLAEPCASEQTLSTSNSENTQH